jgi:hydroxyacylglutathione hydrolase
MENVAGFLEGGVAAWDAAGRPLASSEQITVDELKDRIGDGRVGQLVDVRRPGEWNAGHIADAVSIPLHELASRTGELDRSRAVTVICASGYRSSIATSLLQPRGFTRATNVAGGMNAWSASRLAVVA